MSTLARVVAALLLAVSLPAHALQDFDACVVGPGSAGTVESVRLVPVQRDLHAFDPEVLEHRVQPDEAQELVVLAHQEVIEMLLDEESGSLAELSDLTGKAIRLQAEAGYLPDQFDVVLM